MENEMMDEQLKEFLSLWHRMLKIEKNLNLEQKYPNFVGLTTNEISVIDIVSKNPQVILKDIGTILELPKSTLTNMINRLEKKGYLFRIIAKQDLRSYGLELTEKGVLAQKEHIEYETMFLGKIMSSLNMQDRQQLIELMKKMIAS